MAATGVRERDAPYAPLPPGNSIVTNLPFDVLRVLLSFLSPHARLAGASLVCRRWRSAVKQTVESLDGFSDGDLGFLPALRNLTIARPFVYRSIPTTLAALTLWLGSALPASLCDHLSHLRSLTSLNQEGYGQCLQLVHANQSTLTALRLSYPCPETWGSNLWSFDHLVSLSVKLRIPSSLALLAHMCDGLVMQLTSLDVSLVQPRTSVSLTFLHNALFPKTTTALTHLALSFTAEHKIQLAQYLNCTPRLKSIALDVPLGIVADLERCRVLVSHVRLTSEPLLPRHYDVLPLCTRVSSVMYRDTCGSPLATVIPWPAGVTVLDTELNCASDFDLLHKFSSLRSLVLDLMVTQLFQPSFTFPNLKSIELFFGSHTLEQALAILSLFLLIAPALEQISVLGCPLTSRSYMPDVLRVLKTAEVVGISRVSWTGEAEAIAELRSKLHWIDVRARPEVGARHW